MMLRLCWSGHPRPYAKKNFALRGVSLLSAPNPMIHAARHDGRKILHVLRSVLRAAVLRSDRLMCCRNRYGNRTVGREGDHFELGFAVVLSILRFFAIFRPPSHS